MAVSRLFSAVSSSGLLVEVLLVHRRPRVPRATAVPSRRSHCQMVGAGGCHLAKVKLLTIRKIQRKILWQDLLIHPMVTLDQGQGPAILQDHSSGEGPRGSWVIASSELLIFLRSWFEFKILADRDVTDVHSWSMAWTMQRLLICGKFNHEYWNSYSKKHVQNRLMAEPVQRKSDSFSLSSWEGKKTSNHKSIAWPREGQCPMGQREASATAACQWASLSFTCIASYAHKRRSA